MSELGQSLQPVAVSTDAPDGGAALRVVGATAAGGRPVEGGASLPVYVVSDAQVAAGYPVQGNTPVPVLLVSDGRPSLGQRPVPVYVVSGSLNPTPPDPSPPVAGQALWLDVLRAGTLFQDAARATLAGVGDPVGSWYDPTVGIGATESGATRPTRAADQLAFGGSQSLNISGGLGVGNGQWTVFVVGQINSGNPGLFEFADTDPGTVNTGPGIGFFGGTTFFRQVNGTADLTSGSYAAGTRRVYAIRRDADSFDAFVNEDTVGTVGLAATPASAAVTLGRWYPGAGIDPLPGDLRAFLVYASALSDGDVAATIAYLAARHGVTL